METTVTTDGLIWRATSRKALLSSRALSRAAGAGPAVLLSCSSSPAPVTRAATAAKVGRERMRFMGFMVSVPGCAPEASSRPPTGYPRPALARPLRPPREACSALVSRRSQEEPVQHDPGQEPA